MGKKRLRSTIINVIIIFALICGMYIGFITNRDNSSNQLNIFSVIQIFDNYSAQLNGSFIVSFFSILIHNYILDIFYSIISCLTLGVTGIINSFLNGNTFGYVLQLNHNIYNVFFVSLEAISMAILTSCGANIGWTLIIKNKSIELKKIKQALLIVFILLAIAALVETFTIKEILK